MQEKNTLIVIELFLLMKLDKMRGKVVKKMARVPFLDLTGKVFDKLTVIERIPNLKGTNAIWKCLCSCGNEILTRRTSLRAKHTESCGCINITHIIHWKTNEKVPCQASYEVAFVNYLNENKLDFNYQIETESFDNRKYFIDFFVKDWGMYIEIKGIFRQELSKQKWEHFHNTHLHNSVILYGKDLKALGIKIK